MHNFTGRTDAKLYSLKEKQKSIGKIGTSTTLIDLKTNFGKLQTYYDGNKIEARDSFVSVRANNCVFKGKWCYEVLLESNGLFQFGFCQLKTPFTPSYGVGDDIHSFGYDGYRLSCWNEKENRYGKVWDYGDIIGVCIDLEKRQVEFFQNGESLGIALKNIEGGNGQIGYFPGLSFSNYEKCAFNFGAFPFIYNYPGYEPLDIPKSQYNGSFEVTSSLLQCINQCNLLEILDEDYINIYIRKLINQKIFYFLVNVSFKDFFLCKCLLFPFMYSLLKKNKGHYQIFLEQLMKNLEMNQMDIILFFSDFFEKLTNLIEEYGIMGPKFYTQYELYTTLFIEIIDDEIYFREWNRTKNFFGHLRNIFTSNTFHFRSVYDKITEFYGDKQSEETIGVLLYKIIQEGNLVTKQMNEYDEKYLKMNQIMIEKIFNYYQKKSTLCQGTFIFYDLMRACYPINTIKDYIYNLNNFMNSENKKNILAFKNVILSYMAYFFDKYKNIPLKELPIGSATIIQLPHIAGSIKNELSSSGIYVSYFREENIGGKSNKLLNVTVHNNRFLSKEVFAGIQNKPAIKFNILVRLISLMDKFFFAYYELQSYVKDYIFEDYIPAGHGTTLVNALFRYYFYIFNEYCQIVLYNISFFLIKWLNNLILKGNILNVILLPLYLVDFPFQIAQLMLIFKSKILYDDEYRRKINKQCDLFKNDDFLESLLNLYITLFEDKRLSKYDSLVESLGWKIFLFLREEKSRKIIIKRYYYIEFIMKGISNIMTKNNADRIILRILTIIHKTTNEKEFTKEEILDEEINSQNVKKILKSEEYKTIFKSIISYFGKHLNSKLTTYCYDLDNCKQYCIDKNFKGKEINRYEAALKSSYKGMCSVINFYEFALDISPESFFQKNEELSLSLIYLRNFFINLTSRILDQPYFGYIEQMLNHIHANGYELIDLVDSAINFVLTCKSGSEKNLFIEFIVNTKEIFIHTLINIYSYGYNIMTQKIEKEKENNSHYKIMQKKYEEYKELVYELKEKRNMFENENIKNLENCENYDEELTCIICYRQIADHRINPCMHRGCKECLLTYMSDNTKCFMCRQQIISIQKIPKEEIEILKKKKEKKDKDKKENNKIINKDEKKEEEEQKENKNEKEDEKEEIDKQEEKNNNKEDEAISSENNKNTNSIENNDDDDDEDLLF